MDSQPRTHTAVDFSKAQAEASSHAARDTPDEQRQRSSSPDQNSSLRNRPSKKRYRPSDEEDPIGTTETVKAQAYRRNLPRDFQVRMGSPWDWYRKVLDVEHLDNSITVAERKAPHSGLVAIKLFPSAAAEKALERHQRVTHENIVDVLDAFTTETSLYIVLEHLPISLSQIVEGVKYPNEWQLAAILKQIICGLVYLEREKFQHGSLHCSVILLSAQGDLKITNLQCCETVDGTGEPRDVRALSSIMMELMQKYVKDDGAVGVDNLRRWPTDGDAVAFLSETTSAASALELQNVCDSLSLRLSANNPSIYY
ncbi:kinase-like domain-containing protein [Rhexocercosporidium sp. MPI-PUGE-AT-0058]|nr:kinase-like domain-containing protein [Rhexocercosporidium sp. MPI-PUGE-AT-0058]